MLSPRRLVEKAKKGLLPSFRVNNQSRACSGNGMVAKEGHFVVYSVDGTRFTVPLAFLKSCIFEEFLEVSAEEFGLPSEGPITLACSGLFMEYILSMLKGSMSRDVEKVLLASIDANRCWYSSLACPPSPQQRIVV